MKLLHIIGRVEKLLKVFHVIHLTARPSFTSMLCKNCKQILGFIDDVIVYEMIQGELFPIKDDRCYLCRKRNI